LADSLQITNTVWDITSQNSCLPVKCEASYDTGTVYNINRPNNSLTVTPNITIGEKISNKAQLEREYGLLGCDAMCISETDFSGEYITSIFRAEKYAKQAASTSKWQAEPVRVGFLLGLLFDHEDGGDLFPRNVWLSRNYTWRYKPEDRGARTLESHRPQNLRSSKLVRLCYSVNLLFWDLPIIRVY
jgi:hypothetical protein